MRTGVYAAVAALCVLPLASAHPSSDHRFERRNIRLHARASTAPVGISSHGNAFDGQNFDYGACLIFLPPHPQLGSYVSLRVPG